MNLYKNAYLKFFNQKESLFLLGYFNDELTILLTKLNSIQNNDSKKMMKRLSFITVETFQNIVRHGYDEVVDSSKSKIKIGMFAFSKLENGIILGTSNQIKNTYSKNLEDQLTQINQLDSEELKQKYKDTLLNKERTENGGAGVGFLAILRKTSGKINFKINKINDKISNFLFQSNLINNQDFTPDFITENHYNFMTNNNILLFRKGIFDHDTMVIMTQLLNVKLELNVESSKGKRLFFIVGEIIQNIYNHGYANNNIHEGIFMIKKNTSDLSICSGNFVLSNEIKRITDYFNKLNNLNEISLKELYKKQLMSPIDFDSNLKTGGIGLLEIKKHTNSPINFNFEKVNNTLSFLTICINI